MGHRWLQMTGPLHQVRHQRPFDGELLDLGSEGQVAVTIMVRCALFSHCRSRGKRITPSPAEFFGLLASQFREALTNPWRLPTLAERTPFPKGGLSEQSPLLENPVPSRDGALGAVSGEAFEATPR